MHLKINSLVAKTVTSGIEYHFSKYLYFRYTLISL